MKKPNINKLSYTDLMIMLCKIQQQMFTLRLNKVISTFNSQKDKSTHIVNKIETLIVLTKKELNSVKRIIVIENYLTELEVLLDIDIDEEK